MIRGILYWSLGPLFTLFLAIPFYLLLPLYRTRGDLPHRYIGVWARLLIRIFYGTDIELSGTEHITPGRNFIIVSNHRSYTDILFAHASLRLQFRWLAKSSLFRIPVFGTAMKIAGYIPVERKKYISASRSLDRVKETVRAGISVWIFPEGTRTPKNELGVFKRGAFLIARDTAVPLLPVVLVNTDRIFIRPFVIEPKTVKVMVLEPVLYSDFTRPDAGERQTLDACMRHVRDKIQSQYNAHVDTA
jgi:1-acyl-sn-glycerol-3-phosphate acyltransferase